MLRGIYSAASGMTSQMFLTDIMANNLANISTAGYKQSSVQFKTFGNVLINRMEQSGSTHVGGFAQGSQIHSTSVNFKQGELVPTGNALDLAIQGDGFFTVQSPDGQTRYTRAGNFTRDDEGYLITTNGERVQGQGGDIQIPPPTSKIGITASGDVVADGQVVDRLKVVNFDDPEKLTRIGSNMYTAKEDTTAKDAENYSVEQGFIERSNANVITEMVNSMTGLRVYETLQKSIQMQNETLSKAVNEVGKV